ncbi:MAG: spore coat protein U domain-containing protein [Gammaproteobacteria bacterium]|nr:MAG: spore coat protein U domain-containing protein [Gammaproteobacteria bacterium]
MPIRVRIAKHAPLTSAVAVTLMLAGAKAMAALSCSVSPTPVSFGLYTPMSATDLDSTGNVQVNCDGGKGQVTIQLGAGASGDATDRRMFSGPNTLRYNLYDRAARNQVWGDGAGGTRTVKFNIPKNQPVTYDATVYGRIFSAQSPSAGFYVDNIVVTVFF